MCHLLLSKIHPPESHVFGVVLTIVAILAATGNTFSLIILWNPKVRSNPNKLLASLIIADALTGYLQIPVTVYELFHRSNTLRNCTVETVRAFLVVSLTGASSFGIAFIAYDRYILLTKLQEYEKFMSSKKTYLLIVISWIVPVASVSLRLVGPIEAYFYVLLILTIFPLIMMVVAYVMIVIKIRKNEEELRVAYRKQTITDVQLKQRGNKMARIAVLLIIVYSLSSLPTCVYFVAYLLNSQIRSSYAFQVYYLCAQVIFGMNSCINPVIYAAKYPEFHAVLRTYFEKFQTKMKLKERRRRRTSR